MQAQIKHLDGSILYEGEHEGLREAVVCAIARRISLNDASLNRASLNGASLNDASLIGASLNDASLNDASLIGASLIGASLIGASLNDASLIGASLNDANVKGAAFLRANLRDVDWGDEEREDGPLSAIFCEPWVPAEEARAKEAAMAKFASVGPHEVEVLRQRLLGGLVDGSTYHASATQCGCLVGTLEFAATEAGDQVRLKHDSSSPDEQWFLHIRPGHKPQWNGRARVAVGWCEEALATKAIA